MQAIGIRKGRTEAELLEVEVPRIKKQNEALLQMIDSGICGTDRDIIETSAVDAPEGEEYLILGHEGLGRVIETGKGVKKLKKGDYATIIPRHGCGICEPCKKGRSDFCETGLYTASGQHKRHGFSSEYYAEEEEYLVKVPKSLVGIGALTEPFSVVEKGIMQIEELQARIPEYDLSKKKALVFGMGPVGIAAVAILRARNTQTYVLGRRAEDDPKVKIVRELGAIYANMAGKDIEKLKKETGTFDIIIEATGATQLVIDLIELLNRNGVYLFLGIPKGAEELCFNIRGMLNKIVRQNITIMGSVNSQMPHFKAALKSMAEIQKKYNNILDRIITHRYSPEEHREAFRDEKNQIKAAITFPKKAR